MSLPDLAYPGLPLAPSKSHTPGSGTHIHNSTITASILGIPTITPSSAPSVPPTLSVLPPWHTPSSTASDKNGLSNTPPSLPSRLTTPRNALPKVGSVVLARVVRLQAMQAGAAILVVDGTVCADGLAATVRREDVRGWEIDRVRVEECFRVGDVVRAVVISLGDQASYYISTARNELGVLLATSEDGNRMYPISWKEFRDPVTGKTEGRKVAKPI